MIEWDEVSNAYRYKILFGEYFGDKQELFTSENNFGITLLYSKTLYYFEVYSGNLKGWSWWPSIDATYTLEAYGNVTFNDRLGNLEGYTCNVHIDGISVGTTHNEGDFTVQILTGWHLMEVYTNHHPYYWHWTTGLWFYLTTDGVYIRIRTGDHLEIVE